MLEVQVELVIVADEHAIQPLVLEHGKVADRFSANEESELAVQA
jgi:hypothetical protein